MCDCCNVVTAPWSHSGRGRAQRSYFLCSPVLPSPVSMPHRYRTTGMESHLISLPTCFIQLHLFLVVFKHKVSCMRIRIPDLYSGQDVLNLTLV